MANPISSEIRQAILETRKEHPEFTFTKIASIFKVSNTSVLRFLGHCPSFSKKYGPYPDYKFCKTCGRDSLSKFCSVECRDIGQNIVVLCTFCKMPQKMLKTHYLRLSKSRIHYFCSVKCRQLGGQFFSEERKARS